MYRINTVEPFWWALFMAGAGVIGMLLPIQILVQGLAIPLGALPPESYSSARLMNLLGNPIVKLYLFGLASLTFFHWAHRFRYFVFDLGLRGGRSAMAVLCYGTAILGTIYIAMILLTLV